MTTRIWDMTGFLNKELDYFANKRVLITGGSGYIGSSVINVLRSTRCRITALDMEVEAVQPPVPGDLADISRVRADIRDVDKWTSLLEDTDIIFYFAAQTSSNFANANPRRDMEVNLMPLVGLIEACLNKGYRPDIIFSGTVTEAGLTNINPVNETFKDQPITVYDIDKLAAEKYLQYYGNQMNGKAVILRLANVYGPGLKGRSADRGILNMMVKKALMAEPLVIYGDGNFMRDYIYIDDVVNAFLTAAVNINALNGKYYIIGSGTGHTIKDMLYVLRDEVASLTGISTKIEHAPFPANASPIELRNFVADSAQFAKLTGWRAQVPLKEGVNRTITYFLKKEMVS